MPQLFRTLLLMAVVAGLSGLLANGQDSQSLGDVARKARQQKQDKETQDKTGPTPAPATPKVITNEEISEHSEATSDVSGSGGKDHVAADSHSSSGGAKAPAEQWKSQIRAQKDTVSTLQSNIDKLQDSIQYAPANCVSGCVQWNEHQQQKQQQVERMRAQLEIQKQHLEEMQESARQQGYGSSVYDP
jgi:hypothetical protein